MVYDLQKAGIWKRIAAWMFDGIILSVLAVGMGALISFLVGYDGYSEKLDKAYAKYEAEYGIVLDISQTAYQEMEEAERLNYDAAYEALIGDEEAMYAYNMMLNLSFVILSLGILGAYLIWEFTVPLLFGNGQTLGKKVFGLCLMRNDGVMVNTMQMFARTVLGKFTIETMIPVYLILMLFWGTMDITGVIVIALLAIGQAACIIATRTNSAIHDLLAGTTAVDMASQKIFPTTEAMIEYKKKLAAEKAAQQEY